MSDYGPIGEMDKHDLQWLAERGPVKRRTKRENELVAETTRVAQEALWLFDQLTDTSLELAKEMGASVMYKSQRNKLQKQIAELQKELKKP